MINAAHFHLILVHIPIILFPLATVLLALSVSKRVPQMEGLRTIAHLLLLACSVVSIAAYLSGEGSEDLVENFQGVLESAIERHEEAALYALCMSCFIGLWAGLSLFAQPWFKWASPRLLVASSVITSLIFAWVGFEGGKIRHPEAYPKTGVNSTVSDEAQDRD